MFPAGGREHGIWGMIKNGGARDCAPHTAAEEAERVNVCAFTGHRPGRLPWGDDETDPRCLQLKRALADAVRELSAHGCRRFLCGMAMGSDWYFCEAVTALRAVQPDVTLEAVIPWSGQPDAWPEHFRSRYYTLLAACDVRNILQNGYTPGCLQRRNLWMVEQADCLLAVYDGQRGGGTAATVAAAGKRGLRLVLLHPLSGGAEAQSGGGTDAQTG